MLFTVNPFLHHPLTFSKSYHHKMLGVKCSMYPWYLCVHICMCGKNKGVRGLQFKQMPSRAPTLAGCRGRREGTQERHHHGAFWPSLAKSQQVRAPFDSWVISFCHSVFFCCSQLIVYAISKSIHDNSSTHTHAPWKLSRNSVHVLGRL